MLELVGLAGYERQQPHQLSGGEQQRVALARAIVFQPRVLLFDEPLSNLDAKLRVEMREQIRSLQKRIGITTVYVTHDQEEAMAISDRIAVMDQGEVAQDGTAQELYYRPASEFVARFIGRTNVIGAVVVRSEDGRVEIDIAGQRHSVESKAPDLRPGLAVKAVVRPEAIGISASDGAGGIAGVVASCTYLGEKCEYVVEAAGIALQIAKPNPSPTIAWLQAPPSACIFRALVFSSCGGPPRVAGRRLLGCRCWRSC